MKNIEELNNSIKELKEIVNSLPENISSMITWDAIEEKFQAELLKIILLSARISDSLAEEVGSL